MAKVLVTGANGFLGSWLTKGLIAEGHEVHILVRKSSDLGLLQGLDYRTVQGDVTDLQCLLAGFKGMEAIFHLAGVVAYTRSQRALMERVNVQGVQNALVAASKNDVSRFVHLSSVTAVGAGFTRDQILNEDSSYNVGHLDLGYFETKHKGEKLVRQAVKDQWVDAVILNPSTIYGPGDATKGSRKVQLKVARGEFKFYTSGGVNVVAVEDVVQGILSAWKSGTKGERYILAGENLLIKELFDRIAEFAAVKPPSIYLPDSVVHAVGKIGDLLEKFDKKGPINSENAWTSTLYHWFDNSKAKSQLNFNPRPAQVALEQSLEWSRRNGLIQ